MDIKTFKAKDNKDQSFKSLDGKKKKKMPKILKVILIILILAIIGGGAYYALNQMGYIQALQVAMQLQKQASLSKQDAAVLAQLKKIMVLPNDVTPTMAVITDIAALQKQQATFFANAKNGDRLIVYPDTAIIYDAAANKIVKVGPVQISQNPAVQPVNFAIYNSLKDDPTNAKTAAMEATIKKAFNNAVVTVKANSAKLDYPQTLVIDLVGKNSDIDKIATAVGGKVSTLPAGEKKPDNVAVLVIIGQK